MTFIIIDKTLDNLAKDNLRLYFLAILLISLLTLSAALIAQYLGFAPCPLCIYQRYPYAAMILFSIAALFIKNRHKLALTAIILTQTLSIIISGYHSGIELDIFAPFASCQTVANYASMSLEEIKNHINNTAAVDCSKPSLVILGVSMAQWNFLFNIFLITISTIIYFKKSDDAKAIF